MTHRSGARQRVQHQSGEYDPAGRAIGAEVIIKGTITEFEPNKRGRGLTLGMALPNTPLGVRLGRNGSTGHVGLDISVVDASTGQVKYAHRVTADSTAGGWTIGLDFKRASIGGDAFTTYTFGGDIVRPRLHPVIGPHGDPVTRPMATQREPKRVRRIMPSPLPE